MLLRDISDVKFDSTRCGGVPTPINPGGRVTIASVRAQYTGTNIKLTSSASIAGIVTSDAASKNISAGSFIIQDASGAAVTVYAGGTITYSIGDSIVLDITNDSLLNYRGSLELKTPFGFALPTPSATGRVVTPLVKTIAEINTALSTPLQSATNLDLVLVKIIGATATGGTTYSVTTPATISLADGSGSMTMFTSSTSTFGATTLPTGVHSWTGHSKMYYSTKEFVLRNTGDVQ